jgi:hypothetical protein
MSHIVPMILERFRQTLQATLIDSVHLENPIRANIVKVGRFQDDPTRFPISVAISPGDPADPEYRDGIVTMQEQKHSIGFEIPPREIGGGQYWWRRGVLQVQCHFVLSRYPEPKATEYAYEVLGRILGSLERTNVADLTDDYGEHAIVPFAYANTYFESGGPPADYIWRGKVLWSVLTYRSPIT